MKSIATSCALLLAIVCAAPIEARTIEVTLLGTGRPDPVIDRFGLSTLVEAGGETLLLTPDEGSLNVCGS